MQDAERWKLWFNSNTQVRVWAYENRQVWPGCEQKLMGIMASIYRECNGSYPLFIVILVILYCTVHTAAFNNNLGKNEINIE